MEYWRTLSGSPKIRRRRRGGWWLEAGKGEGGNRRYGCRWEVAVGLIQEIGIWGIGNMNEDMLDRALLGVDLDAIVIIIYTVSAFGGVELEFFVAG